jgi:magnesium chelatase family protein
MLGMAAAQLLGPLSHEERQGQSDAYAKLGQSLPKLGMRTVIQPPTHLSAPLLFSKYAALAQTGVLFLDELPERGKDVVDSLRQFLETPEPGGKYRNKVIAAQNTCFCGRYSDATGSCTCTAADLAKYQRTFSEAVYQRFPLSCFLEKETAPGNYLSGKDMRESIMRMQLGNLVVPVETPQFLEEVSQKEHFSLRTQRNLVRVATTIAGVEGRSSASNEDITEALTFMYKPHNL